MVGHTHTVKVPCGADKAQNPKICGSVVPIPCHQEVVHTWNMFSALDSLLWRFAFSSSCLYWDCKSWIS
eukprot:1160101-Pelagomonas_calceolata.AAC.8